MISSRIFNARRAKAELSSKRAWAVLGAMLVSAVGSESRAQTLTQSNISATQARQIVDAIIAECSTSDTLVTVTIAIVDRAGQPVMQVRADTASPHNWELAFRKAYTARTFRRSTIDTRDRTSYDAPLSGQRALTNIVGLGGGVPIMKGNEPIGGIGVSGARGGQPSDHACALAGLAAIAADLE